jgi:hypothetical protein
MNHGLLLTCVPVYISLGLFVYLTYKFYFFPLSSIYYTLYCSKILKIMTDTCDADENDNTM